MGDYALCSVALTANVYKNAPSNSVLLIKFQVSGNWNVKCIIIQISFEYTTVRIYIYMTSNPIMDVLLYK